MPDVKLKVDGREVPLDAAVTTLGRTTDNVVSFPNDPNVSRYHAEIELRDGEYCLIDLGSSNGTTVNDAKVRDEVYLKDGDVIVLGGTSRVEFGSSIEANNGSTAGSAAPISPEPAAAGAAASSAVAAAPADAESGGSKKILLVAAIIACIALLFVGVAAAVLLFGGGS